MTINLEDIDIEKLLIDFYLKRKETDSQHNSFVATNMVGQSLYPNGILISGIPMPISDISIKTIVEICCILEQFGLIYRKDPFYVIPFYHFNLEKMEHLIKQRAYEVQ